MDLHFKWVKNKARYQTGESLYLNKIKIGSYSWNSAQSQGNHIESMNWEGRIELPSLSDKARTVYGGTQDEIKHKIEQIITNWFKETTR